MTSKGFFITGTDTNIGKTVVCAWLTHHLKADYWKPIQSGYIDGTDKNEIQRLTQIPSHRIHPESYCLKPPLSPHAAAILDGTIIDLDQINIPITDRPLIIEGAGGVFVPLNDHLTMLDLMEKCAFPIIIVAANQLGTINHTCLTIAALRQRNLHIAGVILNQKASHKKDTSILTNKQAIEHYGKVKVLAELEQLTPLNHKTLTNYPCSISPNRH